MYMNLLSPPQIAILDQETSHYSEVVKNHNPRKGTETFVSNTLLLYSCFSVKNHNPRKGTETLLHKLLVSHA